MSPKGNYVLRAYVHHSMKNLLPLNVTVIISSSANLKNCTCSCKASASGRCAHVTALLLHLDEYVKSNGCVVQSPSTSKPCERNLAKKRQKNPKPLHKVTYESVKRKQSNLYDYDHRSVKFPGKVNPELLNNFVIAAYFWWSEYNETPMWLTLFELKFEDFQIDKDDLYYYFGMTKTFTSNMLEDLRRVAAKLWCSCRLMEQKINLIANYSFIIAGFELQPRCVKKVTRLGGSFDRYQCYTCLRDNFWFKQSVTTFDMQYSINEEQNAVLAYSQLVNVPIQQSGLWVNKKYVHLGVSPDGLIVNSFSGTLNGIIEMKCLKALRDKTIAEWITGGIPSDACMSYSDGELVLKRNHSYYSQVQLQLLITEAQYCDFILYSKVGEPNVERISNHVGIQRRTVENWVLSDRGSAWTITYNFLIPRDKQLFF